MKPLDPLHVLEIPTSRRGRIELLMKARYPISELREAGKLFLLEQNETLASSKMEIEG
jgi:hypothetical protein